MRRLRPRAGADNRRIARVRQQSCFQAGRLAETDGLSITSASDYVYASRMKRLVPARKERQVAKGTNGRRANAD